jgi:hypothetical protein
MQAGQPFPRSSRGEQVVARLQVPACGFVTIRTGKALDLGQAGVAEGLSLLLENDLIRYRFDENGALTEAWDKTE